MTFPARKYTPDKPTEAQIRFAANEGMARPDEDNLLPEDYGADMLSTPQRGGFTLRRVGAEYKGSLTIHGFSYVITASVQEDDGGKFFTGLIYEDTSQPREPVALSDLVTIARDPRLSAQAAQVLFDITDIFGGIKQE